MLPKYKANRTKPAPAFSVDLSNLKLLLRFTRIPTLTVPGYEADDVSDAVTRVFSVAGSFHRTEHCRAPASSMSRCWAVGHHPVPVLLRMPAGHGWPCCSGQAGWVPDTPHQHGQGPVAGRGEGTSNMLQTAASLAKLDIYLHSSQHAAPTIIFGACQFAALAMGCVPGCVVLLVCRWLMMMGVCLCCCLVALAHSNQGLSQVHPPTSTRQQCRKHWGSGLVR
jgi:hypothetical protein